MALLPTPSVLVDAGLVLLTPVSPAGFAGGVTTDRSVWPAPQEPSCRNPGGRSAKAFSGRQHTQFHSFQCISPYQRSTSIVQADFA